jgi:RND superfamily putative drug exporter
VVSGQVAGPIPSADGTAMQTIVPVDMGTQGWNGAIAPAGGQSAVNLDVARASAHDRDLLLPLILAVVRVILALLLRALVAPLILTATEVPRSPAREPYGSAALS